MDAHEMQAVAKSASERLSWEVCHLILSSGVKGTTRKDKRAIKKEIDMRKSWIELLDRIERAEVSTDAETDIDGLFVAGQPSTQQSAGEQR